MLDTLFASQPPRTLRARWLSGSLAAHLLIAAIAVAGSRVDARPTGPRMADTTLLFLPRLVSPALRPPEARPSLGLAGGTGGAGSIVVSATPPPRGFQTVIAPGDIPTTIPPVDLGQPALDPRNFSGKGEEGGLGWGVAGGTGPVDPALIPPGLPAGEVVYAATLDDARFEPARLVSQPIPRYPRTLELVAISGRVVLQFIIDTAGTVEIRSIRVLESTHEAFVESARESVSRAVFRPARIGAYAVRQLTRQPISFIARQ